VILLTAVLAGTLTGWGYARLKGSTWHPPVFRSAWLVLLGFLPQWIAFYFPYTRKLLPDQVAAASLVCSHLILLVFVIINFRLPGMFLLAVGFASNLAVILANGGFMPLTVDAATRLVDPSVFSRLTIGERVSSASKDVLLPESQIALSWLADRFIPPQFVPYRFAFSLGDVFIAAGAFWLLVDGKSTISTTDSGDY
jgi:hypothetical protein